MLVASFQIQVRRVSEFFFVAAAHDGCVRGARIEPHVENVVDLLVVRSFFGRHEVFGLSACPGFDAFLGNAVGDFIHDFDGSRMEFPRCLFQEERKRNTPVPLTRDAPIRAIFNHRVQAVVTPLRNELGGIDSAQCGFA